MTENAASALAGFSAGRIPGADSEELLSIKDKDVVKFFRTVSIRSWPSVPAGIARRAGEQGPTG